jgi:hypothetical protein
MGTSTRLATGSRRKYAKLTFLDGDKHLVYIFGLKFSPLGHKLFKFNYLSIYKCNKSMFYVHYIPIDYFY